MHETKLKYIIKECEEGKPEAFRAIVAAYQTLVYSTAFRFLCNEDDAKDVTQETFIRVWENLSAFNFQNKFSTWIYTIVTRLCMDVLKKSNRKTMFNNVDDLLLEMSSNENVERKIENEQLSQIIQRLTCDLSPKQRIVFVLHYFEEKDTGEIQEITGLSSEKIKSNLYVAKQKIITKLKALK